MNHLVEDFIYFIQFVEPRSEQTVIAYKRDLKQYVSYLNELEIENVELITYPMIVDYVTSLQSKYKPNTVSRKVTAVKQFHNYCVRYGKVKVDVSEHVQNRARTTQLPKALTVSEINQLLSFEKKESKDFLDYAILMLLFRGGLRVSECIQLKFTQVYQEERWFRIIGKKNKERMVPLTEDAFEALFYYINNIRPTYEKVKSNYVFINQKGNNISRQYVHRMIQLRRAETNLKKKVSAHTLRHTLATTLLEQEVDLRVIQEILGHADISTTQIYTHVNKDQMKKTYDKYISDPFKKEGK